MSLHSTQRPLAAFALGAILLLAGCREPGAREADSAGLPSSADSARRAAGDTMAMTPAKDADHEFLRKMSDHHQGMVEMASPSATKAISRGAQLDAKAVHDQRLAERDSMVAMIREWYGEAHGPKAVPKHRTMNDTLQSLAGVDFDRTFYHLTIGHHREGVAMVDAWLPRLARPAVRALAETMRADQQRRIAEFEKKLATCCT
jgi:uncharacterized protein (DUF305 family)